MEYMYFQFRSVQQNYKAISITIGEALQIVIRALPIFTFSNAAPILLVNRRSPAKQTKIRENFLLALRIYG
jgi:hypothetical protein